MARRNNRAVELLAQGQPIYYTGAHTGHVLTYEQGEKDAATWADYINVGMEHGAFDLAGLDTYLSGMVDGGPTPSGHRTPAVIVEARHRRRILGRHVVEQNARMRGRGCARRNLGVSR